LKVSRLSPWVTSRLFGKAAQCLLSPTADMPNYPSVLFAGVSPERFHHPLHRGLISVLDLDPVLLTAAAMGPIAML
jgi:hypothetical protein